MTALMQAVLCGHTSAVALLVDWHDAGSFINAQDGRGNTALYLAQTAGHEGIVVLLEKAGARDAAVISVAPTLGVSVAASATMDAPSASATTTQSAAVRLLIEHGAKVNYMVSNRSGGRNPNCALACAVIRGGDADTVRILLDGGAEVSCYDVAMRNSTCLLSEAIAHGSPEMVPLLLRAGAKANWTSRGGDSLPVMAARDGDQAVNVALLVAQGADLERAAGKGKVAADEGRTPLMIAASTGNASLVQALIDAGAKVDQADALQPRMKRGGTDFGFGGFVFPGSVATASSGTGGTTGSGSGGTTNFNPTGITGLSFGGINGFTEPNPEHGCTALI